jgi:hypothetical protein
LGANRQATARESVRILVLSRAWVFLCAAAAFLAFGTNHTNADRYGNPAIADPFGGAGHTLAGLWSRWDSVWFLGIAHSGYDYASASPAFFPLYPLLSRLLGTAGTLAPESADAVFLAALAISLAALGAALWFIHRLAELELGAGNAALCVALVAFFPMAVFYGTIYSESLFLAASAGAVWFARTDRWALAGAFGAAAALTRAAGLLLVVPLTLIYLLGPRGEGRGARPYLGLPSDETGRHPATYPIRRDAAWILLVPAGLVAYGIYLGIHSGDALAFGRAEASWAREFGHIGPVPAAFVGGIWQGTVAAVRGAGDLISGDASVGHALWAADGDGSLEPAGINVEAWLFLVFAVVATIGALRRLPLAYGAYAAVAIALAVSYPRSAAPGYDVPLFSLPRFVAVIFPLFMWLALAVRDRGAERQAVIVSALLLGLYSAQWGTWQWLS